jgi:hypothetical protein
MRMLTDAQCLVKDGCRVDVPNSGIAWVLRGCTAWAAGQFESRLVPSHQIVEKGVAPMTRLSPRRLISLIVTLVILAIPAVVAALSAAPCGGSCQ